jgi:hypothetical protein
MIRFIINRFFPLFILFIVSCCCSKGVIEHQYIYKYKNGIGFAAEMSLIVHAAWLAECYGLEIKNSTVMKSLFCLPPGNRNTRWRFMTCESTGLDCFFNSEGSFQVCFIQLI